MDGPLLYFRKKWGNSVNKVIKNKIWTIIRNSVQDLAKIKNVNNIISYRIHIFMMKHYINRIKQLKTYPGHLLSLC